MKTTLNLNDQILRHAKGQAAQDGITLTKFVEDALREKLMEDRHRRPAFKLRMRDGSRGTHLPASTSPIAMRSTM